MTTEPRAGSNDAARVPVYILAGGCSRRFGSDKARAVVAGIPLLVSVSRALAPVASAVTVVARNTGAYDDLGFRTIGDPVPDRGPLAGLLAAIEDMREPGWLLLSACDWTGLRAPWVARLLAERGGDCDVVAYHDVTVEPLLSLYHTRLAVHVRERIESDDRSLQALVASSRAVVLDVPAGWHEARNVNTPAASTRLRKTK